MGGSVAAEIWLVRPHDELGSKCCASLWTGGQSGWIIWTKHVPVHLEAFEARPRKEWLASWRWCGPGWKPLGGGDAWLMATKLEKRACQIESCVYGKQGVKLTRASRASPVFLLHPMLSQLAHSSNAFAYEIRGISPCRMQPLVVAFPPLYSFTNG